VKSQKQENVKVQKTNPDRQEKARAEKSKPEKPEKAKLEKPKSEQKVKGEKPQKAKVENSKTEKQEKARAEKPKPEKGEKANAEKPTRNKQEKAKIETLKPGNAKPTVSGGYTEQARNGDRIYHGKDNNTAAIIHGGRIARVQRGDTLVRRTPGGPRTVIAQRAGSRVVVHGSGRGYVERSVVVGRRSYVQRTYYANHVAYVRVYRPVRYYGVVVNVYSPIRYYPAAYYGWAVDPWGVPITYSWNWAGDPWFGYYGPYFRPWGVYAGPSFWLTDYLIASNLQAAYQAGEEAGETDAAVDSGQAAEPSATMSDDTKQMIEAEVRRQLAEAQAEAGATKEVGDSIPPSLLESGAHLFVADEDVEVQNAVNGETCVIGEGDAIEMNGRLPKNGGDISVMVRASKGANCPVNSTVSVPLGDLIEMHNGMRDTIDRGLEALRAGQGTNNLPVLPAEAAGEPRPTAFAASLQPDPDVADVINEETNQADQLEKEVMADYRTAAPDAGAVTGGPPTSPALPVDTREAALFASIQNGQTESQVVAILGQPRNRAFLGGLNKQYDYDAGRIIFTDGEVSAVELSGTATTPTPTSDLGTSPKSREGITNGLTEDQVIAILGQPLRVRFLGGLKKVYQYQDREVIFTDGNVSEVQ
jgi:hypothetical protein